MPIVFLYLEEIISIFLNNSSIIGFLLKSLSDDFVSSIIAGSFTLLGKYQPSGLSLMPLNPN